MAGVNRFAPRRSWTAPRTPTPCRRSVRQSRTSLRRGPVWHPYGCSARARRHPAPMARRPRAIHDPHRPFASRMRVYRKTIPLRWGDLDAMNHLNNTLYFRLMEEARISWFVENGMMVDVPIRVCRRSDPRVRVVRLPEADDVSGRRARDADGRAGRTFEHGPRHDDRRRRKRPPSCTPRVATCSCGWTTRAASRFRGRSRLLDALADGAAETGDA